MLTGKFIASNVYSKRDGSFKYSDRSIHLQKLETEEQLKAKVNGKK